MFCKSRCCNRRPNQKEQMPPRKQAAVPAAHGLPQRTRGFSQDKSGSQENGFLGQGNADVVQKYSNEDDHKPVTRNVG